MLHNDGAGDVIIRGAPACSPTLLCRRLASCGARDDDRHEHARSAGGAQLTVLSAPLLASTIRGGLRKRLSNRTFGRGRIDGSRLLEGIGGLGPVDAVRSPVRPLAVAVAVATLKCRRSLADRNRPRLPVDFVHELTTSAVSTTTEVPVPLWKVSGKRRRHRAGGTELTDLTVSIPTPPGWHR